MTAVEVDETVRDQIRELVADIVEKDADEVGWTDNFWEDLGADSLQAIEILSGLERRFDITIEQRLLIRLQDLASTYEVVMEHLRVKG